MKGIPTLGAPPLIASLTSSALPWAVGVYCAVLGAMLLVIPHQFANVYGAAAQGTIAALALASLLGGLGLLASAAFSAPWSLARWAHVAGGLALLAAAASSSIASALPVAAFHAILGFGTLLMAARGELGASGSMPEADAMSLLTGIASSAFAALSIGPMIQHGSTAAVLVAGLLCLAGCGPLATWLLHRKPQLWPRFAHALLALALLTFALVWSMPRKRWIEIMITVGFGVFVALLPRMRSWFHEHRQPELRQRVALVLALATATPLVAAITIASQREENAVANEELLRQSWLARQIAHETAEYIDNYEVALGALATPAILERSPDDQHDLLEKFVVAFPDALAFVVTDALGNVTARSDDLPPLGFNDRQLLEAASNTSRSAPAAPVVLLPTAPAPQIRMATAVRGAALELKGMVAVTIQLKHLRSLLQAAWPGEEGRVYVVDEHGRVIADPRPDGFAPLTDRSTVPPVAAFLQDRTQGAARFSYGSRAWYAAFASLPRIACGVIVERPADLVLAAAHEGRELAFAILLIAITFASVLGALTAGRLCAPLKALTRAAQQLMAGDAPAQLPTSRVLEIDALSRAFGAMRESLLLGTNERERAEGALRMSEERLRMLVEGVRDYAIFMTDPDGQVVVWNAAADGILGYRAEEIVGQSFTKLYPPEAIGNDQPMRQLESAHDAGRFEGEGWRVRIDGSRFWANTVITALRDQRGNLVAYSHFMRDRTERRRTEEERALLLGDAEVARQEAESAQVRYRILAQAIPQIVWTARADGALDYFNRRWFEYSGLSLAESAGFAWQQAIHADDRERSTDRWREAVSDGEKYELEYRLRRADGTYQWHLVRGSPERAPDGNVDKWFGTFTNIDDQKHAEELQRLLADASQVLAGSLEEAATLGAVARLVVAKLADLCAIDILGETAVSIREPVDAWQAQCHATAAVGDVEPALGALRARALESMATLIISDAEAAAREAEPDQAELPRTLQAAGWHSHLCVPMAVRGKALGTITLALRTTTRRYEGRDLAVVEDLGRRIALAIDNIRLYTAAQESRHEAEIANRAKDEFLAVLSHELRTPLNAMIGWVHLLRRGTLEEQTFQRALESITTSADSQAKLIDDLTDVSSIISGKVRLNMRALDPAPVIEAALTAIGPTAQAKNITLAKSLTAGEVAVRADADRLQQVVWNLVSNAVKFTAEGGRVEVRSKQKGGRVEIVVSDTGKGIQRAFLPFVFDAFRQADSTTTRRHGGLGLGLAIARNLVELHGGTIQAESAGEHQGATFTVSLPITKVAVAAAQTPRRSNTVLDPVLRDLRILVVDDELNARELLAMILEHSGAEVRLAASAKEALDAYQSFQPNVLVSDIGMPGEDGYSLMRNLVALNPRGNVVPAVALTAYARTEDRLRAIAAGFRVHMAKPVEPSELLAVIASLATRPLHARE